MNHYDRVVAQINLDAILYNMNSMKNNINEKTKMIAVIKTDAYGHGAVQIARTIEQLPYLWGFAVATAEEALILRKCDIAKPILILGYCFPYAYEELIKEDIRMTVFKEDMIQQIADTAKKLNKKAYVHIKVDTAMSRIGIKPNEEGENFIHQCLQNSDLSVEGIFTHFAKADELNKTPVLKQYEIFHTYITRVQENEKFNFPFVHCSNSAGIVELKNANMDIVRAGITLYGLWPSNEVDKNCISLKPVLTLKSKIVYIKEINEGTQVSYGGTFEAKNLMKIATIPVGYGDGYPRMLSNNGYVLIRGQRAPICGRVCMDQFMVDVTHIENVREYDEVVLIGQQGNEQITMEDLGDISTRFNYELACDLGKRIPREFLKNQEVIDSKDYFTDYR